MKNKPKPTGTKEWASINANIARGCKHNCRYCYAKHMALRFRRIKSADEWSNMELKHDCVPKHYSKKNGTIMFPSSHDIVSSILDESIVFLNRILKPGNKVLIVSKPHLECIANLCEKLKDYKEQILFRFTIGSYNDDVLKFWEPGAPNFQERYDSLILAYSKGYKTSVSCEPLLDIHAVRLFNLLKPYVTDSIWLGALNKHKQRVDKNGWGTVEYKFLKETMKAKHPDSVRYYYKILKDEPLIRWKDSFKKILEIKSPAEIGMDV